MNNQEYNQAIINFHSNLHVHAAYESDDYIKHAFNKFTRNFNSTLAFDFLNESNSKNNNIISWIENSPEQYLNTIEGRKFGGNLAIRDTRESVKKILSSIPELGKDVLENKNLINSLHQFGAEIKKIAEYNFSNAFNILSLEIPFVKEKISSHYFNKEIQDITKNILLGYFINSDEKMATNHKIEPKKIQYLIDIIQYELGGLKPVNLKPIKP